LDLVKKQILTQQFWGWICDFAFLTHSQGLYKGRVSCYNALHCEYGSHLSHLTFSSSVTLTTLQVFHQKVLLNESAKENTIY
jgi:hypothetical protein